MNVEQKKIWIATELFYPDETSTAYILTKIANSLADKFDISIICGSAVYDKDKQSNNKFLELSDKIKLIRKESRFKNKNNLFAKFFNAVFFSVSFSAVLLRKIQKGDTVFIVTNPQILIILLAIIKKIKTFRLVVLVHDVFPENTIPAKIFSSKHNIIYTFSKKIFDWAYSKADKLIVLGSDMKEVFEKKISKYKNKTVIEVIENWAETDIVYPIKLPNDNDKICFLFAGNLGRLQGLDEFLSIIEHISNPHICFHFCGTGHMKDQLKSRVSNQDLSMITFGDSFSRSDQINVLNQCDVALVSIIDEMYGLCVPSKTYNILAAGKPVLFIGHKNSEIAKLVEEHNIGFVFSFKETDSIINFFNGISLKDKELFADMGNRARELALNSFSEKIILDKFRNVI